VVGLRGEAQAVSAPATDTQGADLVRPLVWAGLVGEDREGPFLVGGQCTKCGFVTLGPRDLCPSCWTRNTMQPHPIGRTGTLYTYTVVHQLPPGYAEPFAAGYIDIEGGVRVFAHVENSSGGLRIGGPLRLALEPLRKDDKGAWLYGPRYHPIEPRNTP
jgi:uncharacterized protein